MNRSTGVILSAVLVFIGSALTLLMAVFLVFGSIAVRTQQPQLAGMRYVLYSVDALYVAFAIWGIASGIGLLRLREWARISMIAFSVLLLLCTLPALLFTLFMPIATPVNASANFVLIFKLVTGLLEGSLVALGAAWLYFFNRRSVRSRFQSGAGTTPSGAPESGRPLSISIIGWILLVGSACGGLGMLLMVKMHVPLLLGSYIVGGGRGLAVVLLWSAAQLVAGVGLLRMKRWGWLLAVVTLCAGALNTLSMAVIPGGEARLREAVELILSRMGMPTASVQASPSFWFGLTFGIVFVAVELWYLIARKSAFSPKNRATSSLS